MYVTKNAQIDKTGTYKGVFQHFMGESFVFSKTDAHWKAKRKGLGHAFYKEKLVDLLAILKKHMHKLCQEWKEEARQSGSGTKTIDLSTEIMRL